MAFRIGQFVTLTEEIGPWPEGTTAQIKPNNISVQTDTKSDFRYDHVRTQVERTYLIVVLGHNPNNNIDSFTVKASEIKAAVLETQDNE